MDLWLENILEDEETEKRIKSYLDEKHLQESDNEG